MSGLDVLQRTTLKATSLMRAIIESDTLSAKVNCEQRDRKRERKTQKHNSEKTAALLLALGLDWNIMTGWWFCWTCTVLVL